MKHILNNLSESEKKSIRKQHEGGIKIDTSRFRKLLESSMGNVKPLISEDVVEVNKFLISEQDTGTTVNTISLPDGSYLGSGSGYIYSIKDNQGKDTGYSVAAKTGIRGFVDDDPVTITKGIPVSKTWGQGGAYTYKNVGYVPTTGSSQSQVLTCKMSTDGITNVTSAMISSPPFKGYYSGYVIQGTFKGVTYEWDGNGVSGMSGIRGSVDGEILTENNSFLISRGIADADPNGVWVGFYGGGFDFACYKTTQGPVKCSKY